MYTKIAVPLDGSALAEKALPLAVKLAKSMNASLLLLRATEVPVILTDTPEHELEFIKNAEQYLEGVQKLLTDPANEPHLPADRVQTLVAYGEKVREIAELAPFERCDLIVMTTHGRTGFSKLVIGSVAEKVLQKSNLPLILLRPDHVDTHEPVEETLHEATSLSDTGSRIVVTLDGTPEAEAILEPSIDLAREIGATIYLLEVILPIIPVEYGGTWYGYDIDKETENRREEAYVYLEKVQAKVTEAGLNCVKVVRMGDAADEIVGYARDVQASMLAMATHARGKMGQILIGSVADDVVRKTHLPVLMVHTYTHTHHAKEEQREHALSR